MTILYLALNVVFLAFNIFAFRNAEPSDPWYCSRQFHASFALLFAAFTVRDLVRLF